LEPQVINYKDERVLTTFQLAEAYGASETQIKQNFNNNKLNFVSGKHYILLEGQELKSFKSQVDKIDLPINKFASRLYLWTRRGASRHCKLLGTDKAWEQFDRLEENYFNPQLAKLDGLSPEMQMFGNLFQAVANNELKTKALEQKIDSFKDVLSLNSTQWRKDSTNLVNRMAENLGGFGAHQTVRHDIYKEVERRGGFNLETRLTNKRRRMADEGVNKSKRDKLSKLDVISDDKRLIEIYVAVVKEFAIKYGISVPKAGVSNDR
jgi:hypothetical protein